MVDYEVIQEIIKVETKHDDICLKKIKWGNNPPKLDLRKWMKNGIPQKGFTLTDDELYELYVGLKHYFGEDNEDDEQEYENEQKDYMHDENEEFEIDFRKFLVYSDVGGCEIDGHNVEKIKARVYVVDENGERKPREVVAWLCKDCKAYYIKKSMYKTLKGWGQILCNVYSANMFEELKKGYNPVLLQAESTLHRCGYNVGKKDDLSERARRRILESIIESGTLTKSEIIRHIGYLIERNEVKDNMDEALAKWRADRDWLRGYESTGERVVGVKYIIED